jgi:histidinol-phosphate phosphatase family protein
MLDVDLNKFYDFHKSSTDVSATLFLHPNDHPVDSDLVEIDSEENIIHFHPYPHNPDKYYFNLVNAALYWINKSALAKWENNNDYLDFGKDIFPSMLKLGFRLRGYRSFEYIKDCGTPSRLDKVTNDFISGKIKRSRASQKGKAIFLDRDGTINEEVDHLCNPSQFSLISKSAEAIKLFNKNEFRTCVVTNQPVIARGDCSIDELSEIHKKLDTLIGQDGAYIDRLYYCPHHPDLGYQGEVKEFKIKCNCRKPEIGMILNAAFDLNIDLSKSWLIGDTSSDILTAKNAGLRSILVETGYAGLDNKFLASPDFVFSNLFSAAKFITHEYELISNYIEKFPPKIDNGSIIKIGGLSRSGKTTLSHVLKYYLIEKGFVVHLISIDRWIKSLNERSDTVLGRYSLEEMKNFMDSLCNLKEEIHFKLPYYNRINNQSIRDFDDITINNTDIVIIEGTITFEVDSIPNSIDIFVDRNKENRKNAVIKEYLLRGYSLENALKVYENRNIDEVPFIERKTYLKENAHIVNLDSLFTNNDNNDNK